MIEFRVLGAVELTGVDGRELGEVLAQPKRLALLAYLAIGHPPQFRRRDTLVGYFWPELDTERARAALRQSAHFLRRFLGASVIVGRGEEELGLDRAQLQCDATMFDSAVDAGHASKALEFYRGELLEGFFVSGAAPEFERWLDSERQRLRRRASESAWLAAEQQAAAGKQSAAAQLARRAAALAPDDEAVLRRLISVLDELGDRSGAVHAYEEFASRLAAEYSVEPSIQTKALIEAVRSRAQRGSPLAPAAGSPAPRSHIGASSVAIPPVRSAQSRPAAPDVAARLEAGHAADDRQRLQDLYVLERAVGRTGMAAVYRARDIKHDRLVTLKILSRSLAAVLGPERFLRETRLLARLQHPGIHALYDSGAVDDTMYYVMPYLEAESLRERLSRSHRLAISEAASIACEIADALAYAHAHDVVLRDLKPEGILLVDGHPVMSDFGIARTISRLAGDRLTETGLVLGTPAYMSPEQATGLHDLDERSDIYALGCVFYEMLAGEPPFSGPTAAAVTAKHLHAPVPRVRSAGVAVSNDVERVLCTALAKSPADRYQGAAAFAASLRKAVAGLSAH